jgi:hypothetical protein
MCNKVVMRIAGVPCLIGVTGYLYQPPCKGHPSTCASDWDYYGYEEIEWDGPGPPGRPAPWLDRKLSPADREGSPGHLLRTRRRARRARAGVTYEHRRRSRHRYAHQTRPR